MSRLAAPLLIFIALFLAACAMAEPRAELREPDAELETLARWMTGKFSSADQAQSDGKNFLAIHLAVTPIWPDRADGIWLYVEQAAMEKLDRPYRQRCYRLYRDGDGHLVSEIHTIKGEALRFAGGVDDPDKLASLTPEDIALREGCSIRLERLGPDTFHGETAGKGCSSSLGGAQYATSTATITPIELRSWDRGWNASDQQVWGAARGPYIFTKYQ
jgi:CpeT protein